MKRPRPASSRCRQLVSAYRESAGDRARSRRPTVSLSRSSSTSRSRRASAELKTNYTIEANRVIGARLQSSGRLAYLYLERPVGALVPRSLAISDVADARGNLPSASTTPIAMALSDGARVFGQVRTADGRGVPASVLKLTRLGYRPSRSTSRRSGQTPTAASTSTSSRGSATSSLTHSIPDHIRDRVA